MIWEQLIELIRGMEIAPAVCLLIGILLVIIEINQPGLKVFGISGALCLVMGVALRLRTVREPYDPMAMLFIMVLVIVVVIMVAFMVMITTARRGFILRIPGRREMGEDEDKSRLFLVGKTGVALSKLSPVGAADIEGTRYDVVAEGFFINKNESVTVVAVEGNRIIVKRLR